MERIVYLHGFASGPASKKAQLFAARCAALGATVEVPDLAEGDFRGLTVTGQLKTVERAARGEAVSLVWARVWAATSRRCTRHATPRCGGWC